MVQLQNAIMFLQGNPTSRVSTGSQRLPQMGLMTVLISLGDIIFLFWVLGQPIAISVLLPLVSAIMPLLALEKFPLAHHSPKTRVLHPFLDTSELVPDSRFTKETAIILGFFATSLFDKHKVDDVLWDITANCIEHLDLEDCVIYILDEGRKVLVQKAAYGNKRLGARKILSPIEITVGMGIVGQVAATNRAIMVPELGMDPRYIVDDQIRQAELAVPITCNGRVVGVLDSEHSQKNFFTARHSTMFLLIARLTARKLGSLRSFSQPHPDSYNVHLEQLEALVEGGKMYRDPELGLGTMAEKLGISTPYLSQLFNRTNNSTFPEYVNALRVREAEQMLLEPDFDNYTVVSIGLEAGFNSKSAFYSAFKKHTGMSPTVYMKRHSRSHA